jgi:T5SS/PEP-CTERM-associated repeat protein
LNLHVGCENSKNSRMNSLRISMLGSALACALLAVSPPAVAQMQTHWVDGTGDWFNAANWSAGVPNSNITAKINNGGTAQIGATGAAASDLNLGVDTAHSGTVAVDGSGELSVGAISGLGVNGTGTLNVTNGGAVSSPSYTWIGVNAGSVGNVTVDGAGSTLTVTNELKVGFFGTGTLSIANGGTVSGGRRASGAPAVVGDYGGSQGTVTVDGTGSRWTSGFVQVGRAAPGTLSITNGGTVFSSGCRIAGGPGVQGGVIVDGLSSTWIVGSELLIGDDGTATVQITNGGAVSSFYDSWIAFEPNSSGMVTVDGPNSIWSHQGTLVIGLYAPAILQISNGGVVSVCGDFACIGCDSESQQSTVTVDGADSYWTNTGHVFVAGSALGPGGTSLLRVDNGATVTAANLTVHEPGTLAGSGFIETTGGTTIEGTLAPDQTISFTGNLAFGATATMLSTVTPTSADSSFVEGTAMLNGTLGVTLTGGPFPVGTQYTLLQANGGLNGTTFSTASISAPPGVNAQVTYDTNHVYLLIEPSEGIPTLSRILHTIPTVTTIPRLPRLVPAIAPCTPTPVPRPTPTPRSRPTPRSGGTLP